MIYSPAHGDTAFTVPMFDEFLRRTRERPTVGSQPTAASPESRSLRLQGPPRLDVRRVVARARSLQVRAGEPVVFEDQLRRQNPKLAGGLAARSVVERAAFSGQPAIVKWTLTMLEMMLCGWLGRIAGAVPRRR